MEKSVNNITYIMPTKNEILLYIKMSESNNNLVRLQCVKVSNKLRIRITSPGYNGFANCQFPRAIRMEGRRYSVPAGDISFVDTSTMKFHYRVKAKNIRILDGNVGDEPVVAVAKIYEDINDQECCICMADDKSVVFSPCGHYVCCFNCAIQCELCPICRSRVLRVVKRDEIQM